MDKSHSTAHLLHFRHLTIPMIVPTRHALARWIRANATHARFDTAAWADGGCGPVALRLEWAGSGVAGARDVPVGGEVILGGKTRIRTVI